MERTVLLLLLSVSVPARTDDEVSLDKDVPCTPYSLIDDLSYDPSRCADPKPVNVEIEGELYEDFYPSNVWTDRCLGNCKSGHICLPTKIIDNLIRITVIDRKRSKTYCSQLFVDKHLGCSCSVVKEWKGRAHASEQDAVQHVKPKRQADPQLKKFLLMMLSTPEPPRHDLNKTFI